MISLLKTFGKGLLYVIGAPFFILALAIFGAVGLFQFVFQIIKSIIFFFTGQKFFPELPEDKELRLMKEKAYRDLHPEEFKKEEAVASDLITPIKEEPIIRPTPVRIEEPVQSVEQACFNEPIQEAPVEEKQEDINVLDSLLNDTLVNNEEEEEIEQEETVLKTEEKVLEEPQEEELETYVPRSSTFSDNYEEEEEDADIGVDINYDL